MANKSRTELLCPSGENRVGDMTVWVRVKSSNSAAARVPAGFGTELSSQRRCLAFRSPSTTSSDRSVACVSRSESFEKNRSGGKSGGGGGAVAEEQQNLPLCANHWGNMEAKVACNQLRYAESALVLPDKLRKWVQQGNYTPHGKSVEWLNDV